MEKQYTILLLLLFISIADIDFISGKRYDKYTEAYILRKGGLPQRLKRLNAPYIIEHIYVAPEMRKKISITSTIDLLAYTICEKPVKEIFPNMTTRTYKYIVCPDETPTFVNLNTIKEYCCKGFNKQCCNATRFMSTLRYTRETSFSFRALFSVIGFFIFVIVILVVIKVIFGERIRHRWTNVHVFRQQRPSTGNNYQVAAPLITNPSGNYPGQVMAPQQYPGNQCPYPNTPQYPPTGQYAYGPPPSVPGQYPYSGQASFPPQYASGPPPPFVQYPPGPTAPSHYIVQSPSQPPPDYEKAIRQ